MITGTFTQTPLDTSEVGQHLLDIDNKTRANPLSWSGQFSPELIETLLDHFGSRRTVIFDPFVGSGTVLLESARVGCAAVGIELNPAAFWLASIYELCNLALTRRRRLLSNLEKEMVPLIRPASLFSSGPPEAGELQDILVEMWRSSSGPAKVFLGALIVLSDYGSKAFSAEKVGKEFDKLFELVRYLPVSDQPIRVYLADARDTQLPEGSANLLITSPPYINVFNYHQKYRKSVEAMGCDVLKAARSEIGSNRKHRANRFLTVIQYCLDISIVLWEANRVLTPAGKMIFVVGRESNVRGTRFHNGAIVAELAEHGLGMSLELRQERKFVNRFGQEIVEDILHFSSPGRLHGQPRLSPAQRIAERVLEDALCHSKADVRRDLEDALLQLESVEPSPVSTRYLCHQ